MPTSDPSNTRLPNFDGNRVQGLSNIQTIEQSQSISSIILNIGNFIIFGLTGLSILLFIGSLITGIIMSATNNKSAKVAWIICAISAGVIFVCIIAFALLALYINTTSALDLSGY
jgi:hypothetical protein